MNRLSTFAFYFATWSAVAVLALSACGPSADFQRTAQELLANVSDEAQDFTWDAAQAALQQKDPKFMLVDIRVPIEFDRGHIDGAVNIPAQNMLDEDNLSAISREGVTVALYGNTQDQAHGVWLLLRQMGYDNVVLLRAGYTGIVAGDSLHYLLPETPFYDYSASFRSATVEGQKAIEAVRIVPAAAPVAAKKIEVKPKAKPQVEEEEGC